MKLSKKNWRIALAIIISGVGVFISYAINFVLAPYITKRLGIEAYGFVTLSKTLVSYAGIVTIALTSFVVRYIAVEYHKNDLKEALGYYSTSVVSCFALAFILFFVSIVCVLFLDKLLRIPDELVKPVKFLFFLVSLNFTITTITTPFTTAVYIKNRLDLSGTIKIIAYLLEAAIMFVLFSNYSPNVYYVGVGSLGATLVTLLTNIVLTKKLTPELHFQKKLASVKKVKSLLSNGIWNSLNQLGNVLNSGLDLLVSNLMLSGTETGQISVAKTIGTMFVALLQVVSQPFQPTLIKTYASGNQNNFLQELKKSMYVCGFFGNIAFAGFLALGNLYYKLWLPSEDSRLLYLLTIITIFNYITDSLLRPVYYVNTLTLKNRTPCLVTIFGGLLNVVSMYFLLKYSKMGVFAVVVTTAVIMVLINLIFNPLYASKCLKIKKGYFYPIIFKHVISCITLSCMAYGITQIIRPNNWVGLIFSAIVISLIGILIHFSIAFGFKASINYAKIVIDRIKKV